MNKKKIIIFTNHFYPEQFRINDIAQQWAADEYDVSVITQIPNYPNGDFYDNYGIKKLREDRIGNVTVKRLFTIPRGNNSFFLFLNYVSYWISSYLYALFTKDKADLIFVYQTSPVFIVGASRILSKRIDVPYYVYALDIWPQTLYEMKKIPDFIKQTFNKYCSKIYSQSKKIFISSQGFKEYLLELEINEDKLFYWPQYAEEFYISKNKPDNYSYLPDDGVLNFTFTGNVGEAQGLESLVKAASKLSIIKVHVRFNIVGSGSFLEKFKKLISQNNVNQYFNFIDKVPATEIPTILSETDVSVLTLGDHRLFKYTVPAKLQSYMACAKPVLGSVSGESASLITDASCGLISEPNDIDSLVNNIVKYTQMSRIQLNELGNNSKECYMKHFDKQVLMSRMEKWLQD